MEASPATHIAAGIPVVLDDGASRYVYGPRGLIAQKTSTDDFYDLADGLGSTVASTEQIDWRRGVIGFGSVDIAGRAE